VNRLNGCLFVFWIFVVFLCQGCSPVANPRDGGLFGYSPDLYKQRVDERQQTLKNLNKKTEVNQKRSKILDDELTTQQAEIDRLQVALGSLDSELIELQKRIVEKHYSNDKAQEKQTEINLRIKEIMRVSQQTGQQIENGMLTDKESEVQRLKEKLNHLVAEAELLGQL
jgi:septal ring factor EnvC (AmiA/AmiB activator)